MPTDLIAEQTLIEMSRLQREVTDGHMSRILALLDEAPEAEPADRSELIGE